MDWTFWTGLWDTGLWWLLLLVQVAGIAMAGHVVSSDRSTQGTVAWGVSLVLAPLIAVPLYLFFGRNRLDTYVAARRRVDRQFARDHAPDGRETKEAMEARERKLLHWKLVENLAKVPFSPGNAVRLYFSGQEFFDDLRRSIGQAEHSLLFQFFIFRDDAIGRGFIELLKERARAGVKVCFLVDAIGSRQLSRRVYRELREAGVEIGVFLPGRTLRGRLRLNFRNHRKVVVIDGKEAWLGGNNVGLEYTGRDPAFGPWRDTHLRVRGPVVNAVQLAFVEDWYWVNRRMPPVRWDATRRQPEGVGALCLATGPVDLEDSCTLAHVHMINRARYRLWIHSPYFVPSEEVIVALQLATMRGVDVRILLPSTADKKLVWLCSFYYSSLPQLRGVRFFRYKKGFFHSKMLLLDEELASVGTINFDNRSFRINFEVTLLMMDDEIIRQCHEQMLRDFADAVEDPPDPLAQQKFPLRLAARSARLLSPLL